VLVKILILCIVDLFRYHSVQLTIFSKSFVSLCQHNVNFVDSKTFSVGLSISSFLPALPFIGVLSLALPFNVAELFSMYPVERFYKSQFILAALSVYGALFLVV